MSPASGDREARARGPIRVLIVGGGHASLPLLASARRLTEQGARVTLISDCDRLWYSGMTPEYLGGVYRREDVTIDLDALCRREGVRFVPEPAVALDPEAREVETPTGARFPYDVAAIDVGATNPAPEAAGPAIRTKPLHKIAVLGAWLSEASAQPPEAPPQRLVVVGAGAAGVEAALNVAHRPDVRGRIEIVLVEPGGAPLASFPKRAQAWATRRLTDAGVEIRTGATVDRVEAGAVVLASGERLRADRVLWATGSVGQPWLAEALESTARGFVQVRPTLQAHGRPRVFVAGDAAVVDGHESLARVGVHAVKQGPTLRRNVQAMVAALASGASPEAAGVAPWRPYPAAPLILSSGRPEALYTVGPLALTGGWALRLKHRVDRAWIEDYLTAEPSWAGHFDRRAAANGPEGDAARG